MKRATEAKRIRQLVRLLDHSRKLQERLLALVQAKIDAMRRADTSAMRELTEREQTVVRRVQEGEELRRRIMDRIGAELGWPEESASELVVSRFASRLPAAQRAEVLAASRALREVVSQVAQVNRVAGMVSREVINHLGWVFAAVRPREAGNTGYAGDGAVVAPSDTRLFEAVG